MLDSSDPDRGFCHAHRVVPVNAVVPSGGGVAGFALLIERYGG